MYETSFIDSSIEQATSFHAQRTGEQSQELINRTRRTVEPTYNVLPEQTIKEPQHCHVRTKHGSNKERGDRVDHIRPQIVKK